MIFTCKQMRGSTVSSAWPGNSLRPVFLLVRMNDDFVLLGHLCSVHSLTESPTPAILWRAAHCPPALQYTSSCCRAWARFCRSGQGQLTPLSSISKRAWPRGRKTWRSLTELPQMHRRKGWKWGEDEKEEERTPFCVLTLTTVKA